MRTARHGRLLFALALALLLGAAPAQEQSSAPQAPTTRPPKPDARKARQAYEKGLRAEQARDWPAAFAAYEQGARYAPSDAELLLRREAARFRMVEQHTDRAEREALAGHFDHAREELRAALEIDPGYSVARERLVQFESPAQAPPQQEPSPLLGPVQIQPQPGARDFDFRGDVRGAYEAIAQAFGLIASFDADLPVRSIRFRVRAVDFPTAMALLGQQTNTFWRALDARTFFVAENTPPKRSQYAAVVVRTFTLPNSTTPDRMTETMRLVRDIVGVTHTELDARSRTLTVHDSPENVALAGALIQEIEQAPSEVMLEIELLEVDQTAARRLGITPPSSAKLITINPADVRAALQAKTTAELLAIIQRVFGAVVPPLVAFGGGRTIFLANLPSAAADFSEALNLIRSGRRMLLRAQDGQPATFFVGERFPVALALLGASLVQPPLIPTTGPISFPRADFITGGSPIALVAGTFTAGGHVDLAVANQALAGQNQTANSISVFPGNPDGTFGTRADTLLGFTPVAIATADFDGDGKQDLAVVSGSADAVSILFGKGDGTFKTGPTLTPGSGPIAIVAADFNGDGHTDLAVVNQTAGTITVFLNNPASPGTFTVGQTLTVGAGPVALVAADLNGDGHTDLAVVNQAAGTVSIFLNSASTPGTFSLGPTLTTGKGPAAIVAADFNGDGQNDLAVANQTDSTLSIFLNSATSPGTFSGAPPLSTGSKPAALAAADFNVDGKLDLAVANHGSSTVSLLLGNGDGTFGTRLEISTGSGPAGIIAPDVNSDSRPDVVTADQNANAITVILNPPVSLFAAAAASIPQRAYPGAEYEDLGLKVRATPRVHADDEVTLQLTFEIRSLAGASVNGIPVISNRTIQQTVRLRENETSVISGIVDQEETRAITGLPGFARAAGHVAGRRDAQQNATELLILITPRQLRLAPRTDRSIYAGRGSSSPGAERARAQQ